MNHNSPKVIPTSWARCIFNVIFALAILNSIPLIFAIMSVLFCDTFYLSSHILYGSMFILHLLIQSIFACCENKRMKHANLQCSYTKKVGLIIPAFQEDPWYLEQCLKSAKECQYPQHMFKIVMVVDGNTKEDLYMMEKFKEIFKRDDLETYIWDGNYHFLEISWSNQVKQLEEWVKTRRCVCIMQKNGGKREAMYTAIRALGDSVDYIQVCNSDTKLNRKATVELVKVLESCDTYGAVGGDVRIMNDKDSFISFMSSLNNWITYNVQRACQSYFNCVTCISAPLGLYRNDLLQHILESWYHQSFLGTLCTFGEDWHLTNQILKMGYGTKYTSYSHCYTETTAQLMRWLNHEIRWSKAYYREWLDNMLCWHKHHMWMVYESLVTMLFPFLVTAMLVTIFYTGGLWHILWMLFSIQLISLVKGLYASCLRRNLVMVFMSAYSLLYIIFLLPTKYFAICTISKNSWGTSGRKQLVHDYVALVPIFVWFIILFGGLVCALLEALTDDWITQEKQWEIWCFKVASVVYCFYWTGIIIAYFVLVRRCCRRRYAKYTFPHENIEMQEIRKMSVTDLKKNVEITKL